MSDLTTMGDEALVDAFVTDVIREDDGKLAEVGYDELRVEILRRLSLARIDGKGVSCPSVASGWTARDEACLRGGGAD